MRGPVRAWPKPLHEDTTDLHQACADNDHDEADKIIKRLMSGEGGTQNLGELKRLLLHLNDNKQAWTRHSPSPDLQLLNLAPTLTHLSMP